jgi:DNA repair exonuclease SbcCD ATPase subunit
MKTVKLIICASALIASNLFFTNCSGGAEKEVNPLADSLNAVNSNLNGKLSEKEEALQDFIASFNEIQENLNAIKEKEKIISSTSKVGDVKNKEDQIKEDIQAIYDLMAKNKNRIGALSEKLKKSSLRIEGMQKMIENLQNAINQKDGEIADLKTQIEGLNIDISSLKANVEETEKVVAEKTEVIQTAYYAFGTSKELRDKNIITKEGGFIGIGKSTKVKDDFNKDYFTKINIANSTVINIGAKKAKIITNHPSSSYKLVGDKTVEKLEITNPEEFWSASKYLVIVID